MASIKIRILIIRLWNANLVPGRVNPKPNLRASTLLEVIIAMVIIVFVFSISMAIFANVERLGINAKIIQAAALLRDAAIQSRYTSEHVNQTVRNEGFTIEKSFKSREDSPSLEEIDFVAYDQNRVKVAELHQVIDKNNFQGNR